MYVRHGVVDDDSFDNRMYEFRFIVDVAAQTFYHVRNQLMSHRYVICDIFICITYGNGIIFPELTGCVRILHESVGNGPMDFFYQFRAERFVQTAFDQLHRTIVVEDHAL